MNTLPVATQATINDVLEEIGVNPVDYFHQYWRMLSEHNTFLALEVERLFDTDFDWRRTPAHDLPWQAGLHILNCVGLEPRAAPGLLPVVKAETIQIARTQWRDFGSKKYFQGLLDEFKPTHRALFTAMNKMQRTVSQEKSYSLETQVRMVAFFGLSCIGRETEPDPSSFEV